MTSFLEYAKRYAIEFTKQPEKRSIVIAAVSPGNPFPIAEHPFERDGNGKIRILADGKPAPNSKGYLGKACQVGYQSHAIVGGFFFFTLHLKKPISQTGEQKQTKPNENLVNLDEFPSCFPLAPQKLQGNPSAVDELVIQPPQAHPLFVIRLGKVQGFYYSFVLSFIACLFEFLSKVNQILLSLRFPLLCHPHLSFL